MTLNSTNDPGFRSTKPRGNVFQCHSLEKVFETVSIFLNRVVWRGGEGERKKEKEKKRRKEKKEKHRIEIFKKLFFLKQTAK